MRQADRIILNTLSNYALSVVQVGASLVLVAIIFGKLGRAGYGVVTLVTAVWTAFAILSNCIGRAMQRYIPHELSKHDSRGVNRMFNACLAGYFVVGFFGAAVVWLLRDWLLSDPELDPRFVEDGRWALTIVCIWLAVGLAGFAYQKGLECLQRYELTGIYVGGTTVVRTLLLIAMFWMGRGSIALYVATDLAAAVAAGLLSRRALLRLLPELRESVRLIDRATLWMVAGFAAATLLVILGNIMAAHGFRVLIGKRLGMDELGGLSVVLTITTLMWRLINDLSNVLAPAVSHLDARGDRTSVGKLLVSSTKYSVSVAAAVCLVPLAVAGAFFHLLVGDNFLGLELLARVLLSVQVLLCLGAGSLQVLMGLGRLRFTGPALFARGALGLAACYAFIEWVRPSLVGAAVSLYVVLVIGELVLFFHACDMTGMPRLRSLLEALARPTLLAAAGAAVTWLVAAQIGYDRWWKLGTAVAAGEAVFGVLILLAGLGREERAHLMSFAGRAWHARRRAKGLCVTCGCNLSGSRELGRCPECGTAIP